MHTDLSVRDLILIGHWAIRAPWRVSMSLQTGTPIRPELEGGSLHPDVHPATSTEFPPHSDYEADRGHLRIYSIRWDRRPTLDTPGTGLQRIEHHRITWHPVQHWLELWSGSDARNLIQLSQERFGIEHTPEELDHRPDRSRAERDNIIRRRDLRMANGGHDRIHAIDDEQHQLIRRYLDGSHAPAIQPCLF